MKIGKLVRHFIPDIIKFCEEDNKEEIIRLQDAKYSKQIFDINFPFWMKRDNIEDSKRYWSNIYQVDDNEYRVTSQWLAGSMEFFIKYLINNKIAIQNELEELDTRIENETKQKIVRKIKKNSRFRSAAIGNAQNLLIRNILSNMGKDTFNADDWEETKDFFDNQCAYCGSSEGKLEMDHAVPMNKNMLGEHRLGNLVPSCHDCNSRKGTLGYNQFLKDDQYRIDKIEEYMLLRKYSPLINNPNSEIITQLLEKAYLETADVAVRYIEIIELINDSFDNYSQNLEVVNSEK